MSDLIKVTKAGVVLGVHPTCLAAHQAAGWTQTEAEINAGLPEDDDKPARKGRKAAAEAPAEDEPAAEPAE